MIRLVMTVTVSVEDDSIGPMLEYHFARGVDFAIVTANRASQAVLATVQRYVDEGRAHLIDEPSTKHSQSAWATRMARMAATDFGADWVINLDADEFYWPEADEDLRTIFEAVPPRWGSVIVPLSHFLPPRVDDRSFIEAMTIRQTRSLKPDGWRHFTKTAHRASPDVVISVGLHRISEADLPPVPGWSPILGLHYPMRGYDAFVRKVVRAGEASKRKSEGELAGYRRNIRRLDLHRQGRLSEVYDAELGDHEEIPDGLRDGRLVEDRRLADFFAAGLPSPGTRRPVEEVRAELMRAVHEWETAEERHLLARFKRRLDKANRRVEKLQRQQRARESAGVRERLGRLAVWRRA